MKNPSLFHIHQLRNRALQQLVKVQQILDVANEDEREDAMSTFWCINSALVKLQQAETNVLFELERLKTPILCTEN